MDYRLFKLMLEMSYVDTYGKDDKVQKLYKKYLEEKKQNENNNGDSGSRPGFPSEDWC